jgi:hypothetical protein
MKVKRPRPRPSREGESEKVDRLPSSGPSPRALPPDRNTATFRPFSSSRPVTYVDRLLDEPGGLVELFAGRRLAHPARLFRLLKGRRLCAPSSASRLPAHSHEERVRASADPARPRFMPVDPSCSRVGRERNGDSPLPGMSKQRTADKMFGLQVQPLLDFVRCPAPERRGVDLAGPFAEHLAAGNRARQPDHRRGDGEGASPDQPHRCARADDPDRPQGSAPASTGRRPLAAALPRGGSRDDDRRGGAGCFLSCSTPLASAMPTQRRCFRPWPKERLGDGELEA